ncbi:MULTISPECIES: LuxR C-terminal-related transcriptional regulator [Cupriavidus]|uniref:LuxR C-terminal-related transcriptional regulator n=1 Tax=Cupriavidus TaxID=106589 RepID=UPI0005BAC60B|nr:MULTISPECIES: LuxR C-terminal-related transcriptional regulator [Cupriavidus]
MNKFSIRVVIADSHPAVLIGLQQVLESAGHIELVGTCLNTTELVELLQHVACDVVICDYTMSDGEYGDGMALLGYLQRNFPNIGLVVLTTIRNPAVIRTLAAHSGLSFISMADSTGHIITAVHASFAGGTYTSPTIRAIATTLNKGSADLATELSPREAEVVRLFASGNTVTDIAEHLKRSKQTISSQKRSAMRKVGASNDVELITFVLNGGNEGASLLFPADDLSGAHAREIP